MIRYLIITVFIFLYSINAYAVSLFDALNQTYKNNTQLNAEREKIKASEEDINISNANYKPSLTLSGSKSIEDTNKLTNQSGGDANVSDVDPFTTSSTRARSAAKSAALDTGTSKKSPISSG